MATRDSAPLAGVVEEIAEHLVEVLALAADRMFGRDADVDGEPAVGVEPPHRPRQSVRRLRDRAPGAGCGAGRRGAGVREVRVHLASHALDLLRSTAAASSSLARGGGAVGFVRQHRERRLQAVREVARSRRRRA